MSPRLRNAVAFAIELLAIVAAVAILLSVPIGVCHGQDRRASGITVTVAAEGAILADCASTQWALDQGYGEMNPLLGRRPSTARLWTTCAATGAGLALLPRRIRRPVAFLVVVAQVLNVVHNLYAAGRAVR